MSRGITLFLGGFVYITVTLNANCQMFKTQEVKTPYTLRDFANNILTYGWDTLDAFAKR